MTMAAKKSKSKRMFTIFLLISVVISCAFFNWESLSQIYNHFAQSLQQTSSPSTLTNCKNTQLQENRALSEPRTAVSHIREEFRRLRSRRISRLLFSAEGCISYSFLLGTLTVFFSFLIEKSDLTPRYSVITYLHRSDGKKSASSIA